MKAIDAIINIEEITRKAIQVHFENTCESPRAFCQRSKLQQGQLNKFLRHEGGLNTETLQRIGKALNNIKWSYEKSKD
jgi:hypothetical protein